MPTVDRDLRALVDEMRAALVPFAAAIVPDETCLSGWRFGIIPKHADYVRALAALTAAESALSASGAPGPVAVKPLEWETEGDWLGRANSVVGSYFVNADNKGTFPLFFDNGDTSALVRPYESAEAAKAAAQADYETRIRSALAHPQASSLGWRLVPEEPTDAMIEAGIAAVDPTNPYKQDVAANIYHAMLSAAPLPAPQEAGE